MDNRCFAMLRAKDAQSFYHYVDQLCNQAMRLQGASRAADGHPQENQDNYLCDPKRGVAAVFDGMGGKNSAAAASAACIAGIVRELDQLQTNQADGTWVWQAFEAARRMLILSQSKAIGTSARQQNSAGSLLLLGQEHAWALAAGDTRIYRLRGHQLKLVLSEHQQNFLPVYQQKARQRLDDIDSYIQLSSYPLAAELFVDRHLLDSFVSDNAGQLEFIQMPTQNKDLFVLTTDGIHDNLTTTEIHEIVDRHWSVGHDETAIANALVEAAHLRSLDKLHLRSKDDDITACCLSV